ncbi:MAG TPA: carbon storage regulator [Pirellulales bacterium]|nr:carbon storage regulator [Pirellulales bacterium]
MLVLSRRENERIRLGDSIVVTVVRLSGDKVRLGIEAPSNVVVLRDELQSHGDAPLAGVESVDVAGVDAVADVGDTLREACSCSPIATVPT